MKLYELFKNCVEGKYIHTENGGDYFSKRLGNTLYIYFQCSNGKEDWKNNLDFPAKPYSKMGKFTWFIHRGFSRVWKSVKPFIRDIIKDNTIKNIVIVGYSHGAALAALCHEYIWFNRPDLREKFVGYGFGCPRIFWGLKPPKLALRWKRFTVIRNIDDIVTHAPPLIFGYSHVGNIIKIGKRGKYSKVDAHRPENILKELMENDL